MRPNETGPTVDPDTENNYYLDQVDIAEQTISAASSDVCGNFGVPASAVAAAVSGGGWVCDVADDWVSELTQRCGHLPTAFDDATATVQNARTGETERVPKNDPHGLAFYRSWGYRSAMSMRD